GGLVEARRAVDAVAIEEREGGIPEIGGAIDERFGQGRALQKAERGRGMKLDVRHDCTFQISEFRFQIDLQISQSTIASMHHASRARSRKIRYPPPSVSDTSHSS